MPEPTEPTEPPSPTELSERYRPWEERTGLVTVGHLPMHHAVGAVLRTVPTMHHAWELALAVKELLGEVGYADPACGAGGMTIHRSLEPAGALVPVPVLQLEAGSGGTTTVMTFRMDGGVPSAGGERIVPPALAAPDIVPRGERMTAGRLTVSDGVAYLTIEYDEHGLARGSTQSATDSYTHLRYGSLRPYTIDPLARPPGERPISILCRSDLCVAGHALGELAEWVAAMGPSSRTPARVVVPAPVPCGVQTVWRIARDAMRRALWERPSAGEWLVADGFEGRAIARDASRDEAMRAFHAELFRVKPRPPVPVEEAPPAAEPEPDEEIDARPAGPIEDANGRVVGHASGPMQFRIEGRPPAVPWPPAIPSTTPYGLLFVAPPLELPRAFADAGFCRWAQLLDERGSMHLALARDEDDGTTLVGEGVLDAVDLATLGNEIAMVEADQRRFAEELGHGDMYAADRVRVLRCSCWDDARHVRAPLRHAGFTSSSQLDAASLDGAAIAWGVTRIWRGA